MDTLSLRESSVNLVEYKKKLNVLRKVLGTHLTQEEKTPHTITFQFDDIVLISSLIKNELGNVGSEIQRRNSVELKTSKKIESSSSSSDEEDYEDDVDVKEPQSATKFFENELASLDDGNNNELAGESSSDEDDDKYSSEEEEEEIQREFQKTDANRITNKTVRRGILIFDTVKLEEVIRVGGGQSDSLIGVGSFGKVYQSWMRNKGQIEDVVIKKVKICTSLDTKAVQSEVVILSVCQHPNVAEIIGFGISQTHAYIVMNYYEEITISSMKKMTLAEKIRILRDTAKGGEYLHHNKIIHRDLKWGNVMRSIKGDAKILDFGISKIGGSNKTMVGTPEMVPPEIVLGEGKVEYSSKVDIFPFGVMMWIILEENRFPYGRNSGPRIMFRVASGKRPKTKGRSFGCEGLKVLMKECWDQNPELRPSFSQIVVRLEKILEEEKLL